MVVWAAPIRPGVVLGESMSPSFHTGEVVLIWRAGDTSALKLGDVVVLNVEGELYLKRVCASGGETIWGLDSVEVEAVPDIVLSALEVERVRSLARARPGLGRVMRITVPPRHVFVLGDADTNSYDSRHFGAVPVEAIQGRVVTGGLFRLWRPRRPSNSAVMAGGGRGKWEADRREAGRPWRRESPCPQHRVTSDSDPPLLAVAPPEP